MSRRLWALTRFDELMELAGNQGGLGTPPLHPQAPPPTNRVKCLQRLKEPPLATHYRPL